MSVVFVEQVVFGANGSSLALLFGLLQACMLATLLAFGWGRDGLSRQEVLLVPGLLFLGVVIAQVISLTPLGSTPNAPIWQPLGIPASIAINRETLVIEVVKLLALACLFLTGLAIGKDRSRAWWCLRMIVVCGAVYAVFSLTLHFYSPSTLFGYPIWTGSERLAATLGSANIAGTLFGVLLLCATAVLLQHRRDVAKMSGIRPRQVDLFVRRAPVDIISIVLFAICLLMTGSRGALAATAPMLVLLLLWESIASGVSRTGWITPLLMVVALIGALAFTGDLVANRYQDSAQAAADRVALFTTHFRAFQQSPELGSGLGSFRNLNAALMTKANYGRLASMGATHNVFVQWLEQAGWIGSALMWSCVAWLLGCVLFFALGAVPLAVVPRLAIAASGLLMVHGLTDFALEVPSMSAFWILLLGLAFGRGN